MLSVGNESFFVCTHAYKAGVLAGHLIFLLSFMNPIRTLAIEKYGKMDVLVNHAVYGEFGLLETVKLKQIGRQAHLTKTKEDDIEYMKEIYVANNPNKTVPFLEIF